jgi:hypothetical protein
MGLFAVRQVRAVNGFSCVRVVIRMPNDRFGFSEKLGLRVRARYILVFFGDSAFSSCHNKASISLCDPQYKDGRRMKHAKKKDYFSSSRRVIDDFSPTYD